VIVVLSAAGSPAAFSSKVLEQGQGPDGLVISVAAPGKYSDFEDTRPRKLKLDGINVQWIEKAAAIYYWSSGRYDKIEFSD
jgi:hypothetical protein